MRKVEKHVNKFAKTICDSNETRNLYVEYQVQISISRKSESFNFKNEFSNVKIY